MSTDLATQIRGALLESTYIAEVLQVTAGTADTGVPLVGLRVSVTNVPTLLDLPPIVADFRGIARAHAGSDACVYVEIAIAAERVATLPTEAIVIRSAD